MGSRPARHRYCRCGTSLAEDNPRRQCAGCRRARRDKFVAPPRVPAEFWQTAQFWEAFAAQHMGWVSRAYRTHPYHYAVYGPGGISQTLLGQWLGLRQPQVSRFETGPPIRHLNTLQHWARRLRMPAELLWFRLPAKKEWRATAERTASLLVAVPKSAAEPEMLWTPTPPYLFQGSGRLITPAAQEPITAMPCLLVSSWQKDLPHGWTTSHS